MIEEIVKIPRVAKGLREVRFQADRIQTGNNLKILQRGSKQLGLLDPRTYMMKLKQKHPMRMEASANNVRNDEKSYGDGCPHLAREKWKTPTGFIVSTSQH